ncbi:hypothetical protein [Amycolatopsis sp. NPDC050768]|uniref:hypothetical protein n=1 Tax=Amycolatopsis sp. NPDC050768 TaxID=3154839 RepID=UPI0034032422
MSILIFLGGHTSDGVGSRAIAQTKMTISQRAAVDGVLVDGVCTGHFYDSSQCTGSREIARRQPRRRGRGGRWTGFARRLSM